MVVRSYYWYHRVVPRWKVKARDILFRDGYKYFSTGNAGDILVRDLIKKNYDASVVNVQSEGARLLLVGSVSHRVKSGDVLCGIGTQGKSENIPRRDDVTIFGLRGPLSYDEFKRKGYDVSSVKFLMDPGLLVRFLYNDTNVVPSPGTVGFIPHYRERRIYKNISSKMEFIDIDDTPENVCKKILGVEHVFSSSLHGIIFAHALGRPATLVLPKAESMLKYQDYYSSVGLDMPKPIEDIERINFSGLDTSPASINYEKDDFYFPDVEFLRSKGVVT